MEPVATDDMIRSDPGEEEAERTARFSILLVCMLVGLMLAPLFGESYTGYTIARIVGVLILLAALSVVGVHRLAIVLFVPTLVVQLVGHRSNVPIVVVTSVILRALFLAYVTGVIVWHVLRKPRITADAIAGAACAYVLLGLVWANLYVLVERARPGSFDIPGSFLVGRDPTPALTYFSFVTLTSVGYGDIHPNDAGAGGVCAAEAIIGQLYLAIMIARLVGIRVARTHFGRARVTRGQGGDA